MFLFADLKYKGIFKYTKRPQTLIDLSYRRQFLFIVTDMKLAYHIYPKVLSSQASVLKHGLGLVLGHWQTVQTQSRRRTRRLIRVCTVRLNFRKLRVK